MAWLIFFIYLFLFSWLITQIGFIKRSGLSSKLIIGLFLIKVAAGIAYFQFHSQPQYKYRSDTWKFYNESLQETKFLKKDPGGFVSDFFISGYDGRGNLFSDSNSYWNDVRDTVVIKLMAAVNVFTFNNYYADIIFFNFVFFIGLIAFYRLMKILYPDKKYGLIATIFFIPSFLFWCSGIHKDGLIFSALGLVMYFFHSVLNRRKIILSSAIILICLLFIFFLRNYLVFLLLPSLFAGWLVHIFPSKKWLILSMLFFSGLVLFFAAKYIHSSLDLPSYIVDKQQQFKKLEGNSVVQTSDLQPSFQSFITNLPTAIDMGFFRPRPNEKGLISLVASVEVILIWFLVFLGIICRRKNVSVSPLAVSCLIFAILTLLVIGYTVHFSGAIVRYRALVLPFLVAPFLGNLAFKSNIIKKYI